MVFFTKEVHCWICHGGMKLVLPRGLAPRPFAFARRHARLLHLGSLVLRTAVNRLHHAGAAPAHAVWKTAMRAATSMMLELVAEFGIAPNSPRLQRGANLSQLFSLKTGPSTR
jgi:hypothetical protein